MIVASIMTDRLCVGRTRSRPRWGPAFAGLGELVCTSSTDYLNAERECIETRIDCFVVGPRRGIARCVQGLILTSVQV